MTTIPKNNEQTLILFSLGSVSFLIVTFLIKKRLDLYKHIHIRWFLTLITQVLIIPTVFVCPNGQLKFYLLLKNFIYIHSLHYSFLLFTDDPFANVKHGAIRSRMKRKGSTFLYYQSLVPYSTFTKQFKEN